MNGNAKLKSALFPCPYGSEPADKRIMFDRVMVKTEGMDDIKAFLDEFANKHAGKQVMVMVEVKDLKE